MPIHLKLDFKKLSVGLPAIVPFGVPHDTSAGHTAAGKSSRELPMLRQKKTGQKSHTCACL